MKTSKLKLFLCFLRWNLGRKKIENLIFRLNKLNDVKFSIYDNKNGKRKAKSYWAKKNNGL